MPNDLVLRLRRLLFHLHEELLELFDRTRSASSRAACSTLLGPLPSDFARNVVTRFLQDANRAVPGADMVPIKALFLMRMEKPEEKPEGNDSRHLRRAGKESCRGRTR